MGLPTCLPWSLERRDYIERRVALTLGSCCLATICVGCVCLQSTCPSAHVYYEYSTSAYPSTDLKLLQLVTYPTVASLGSIVFFLVPLCLSWSLLRCGFLSVRLPLASLSVYRSLVAYSIRQLHLSTHLSVFLPPNNPTSAMTKKILRAFRPVATYSKYVLVYIFLLKHQAPGFRVTTGRASTPER